MNFLPIFKYRLKDDLRAVAVFLAVTLLCMVLVIYGVMIMVAEMDDRVVSNFSIALTVFTFVIGIVTVREDLRLGIQNGVSRGTSLAASFVGNVAAALVASAGVTLVEWLSMVTQESTNASLVSLYAVIYGYESSAVGQLKSFVLSFVWSGSAAFVGTFLSLMYWRLSKLWRWIVTLGMGAGAGTAAECGDDKRRVPERGGAVLPLAGRGAAESVRVPHRRGHSLRSVRLAARP